MLLEDYKNQYTIKNEIVTMNVVGTRPNNMSVCGLFQKLWLSIFKN